MHRTGSLHGHLLLGPFRIFDQRFLHLPSRHINLRVPIIQKLLYWRWRKNKKNCRQAFLRAKKMYPNHRLHFHWTPLLLIPATRASPHYAIKLETRPARQFPNGMRFLGNQSWLYKSESLQESMHEDWRNSKPVQNLLWRWLLDRQWGHHLTMHKSIKRCQTSINNWDNLGTNLARNFPKYVDRVSWWYVHHRDPVPIRISFDDLVTA